MKKKILFFAFIFLVISGLKAGEIEKISEIMPYGTKLLSYNESSANGVNSVKYYKYGTTTTKENILEFYQKFLLERGYVNVGKETSDKGSAFIFKKEDQPVVIGILDQQENGLNSYLVMFSEPIQGNDK